MRFDVTSNGQTRLNIPLEEFASIITVSERDRLRQLKVGQSFERPHAKGFRYEFKATRVS